jgi:hypothetical protein
MGSVQSDHIPRLQIQVEVYAEHRVATHEVRASVVAVDEWNHAQRESGGQVSF